MIRERSKALARHAITRRSGDEAAAQVVGLTKLQDAGPAAAIAGTVGALAGCGLVEVGLRQLKVFDQPRWVRFASYVAGLLAGAVAVLAARHAETWWLVPATVVWAYALVAAAVCDGFTQRVPTPLVRQATVMTWLLIMVASAATGQWHWAALAALAAGAAGLIFLVCWRYLGAGFGDIRIAVLGGIGLARPTQLGVAVAIAAFIVITLCQAAVTLVRSGNRHTLFPYGPAIAAAFLIAAAV